RIFRGATTTTIEMTLHDRKTRDSYRYCRRLARRTGRNFYVSFYVLPKSRRLAMCALYAFMRKTDDLGDSDLPVEVRRRALADWRKQLDDALAGRLDESQVADPCWPAL